MVANAAVSRSYFLDSCHLTIADFSKRRILSLAWNHFLHFLTLKFALFNSQTLFHYTWSGFLASTAKNQTRDR